MKLLISILMAALMGASMSAMAHQGEVHKKSAGPVRVEQKPWGIAGNAKSVRRTIEVGMTDTMRFTPDRIEVRQGDTIRFILPNGGKLMHEFVLGTKQELDEHAAQMKKFPNMEHDEPYMAHVSPAGKGEIIWTFNRAGDFFFGCLLPGHYEAGMVGNIRVVAK